MSRSFQSEIPKSRINITLDVATGGSVQKKELPLKMLIMADVSGGKTTGSVEKRERIRIDKTNFDGVLQDLNPELNLEVDNKITKDAGTVNVHLSFEKLKDFHPEFIAKQVPALNRLLAMRNLLKDLRSNLVDNKAFQKELQHLLRDEKNIAALQETINPLIENN
jgi:type VI secretion system protein ImpB